MNALSPTPSAPPVTLSPTITATDELITYLQATLDSSWTIYRQPFLNGDRPPVAVLHPIHGLTIYGVYPWDLRNYRFEQRGRYLRYFQRTERGAKQIHSPVRRVEHYVENLINLYLPYIGESIARDRRALFSFQIALYFPQVNTHAAQTFAPIAPGRGTVFGHDALATAEIGRILPATQRPSNRAVPPEWIDDLRFWLAPPRHEAALHQPLQLTEEQRRHISPAPGRHQRLHGVAGSGKTLVIAQRAAQLAAEGKRVLVITFNVTLWQYTRQLMKQSAVDFAWENVEFHHFHGFCKNFLTEQGVEWPRTNNRIPKQTLDEIVPELVIETLTNMPITNQRRYDSILIDEGQDFTRTYYDTLCHFLTDNDEVLFVADRKQNLYLRDDSWLDNMSGTKFRGRWREMKQSYRLAPAIAAEANRFADLFLTDVAIAQHRVAAEQPASQIETGLSLANSYLGWHNIERLVDIIPVLQRTIHWLKQSCAVKPAEIVILTPNQQDGWQIATALEDQGQSVNHILSADDGQIGRKQRRFRKRTFAPDDTRLKVSTIHAFKGWELRTVIVITPNDDQFWEAQSPYLFYVAMTRARQNLIVFNRHPAYHAYGAIWNELYHDPTAPQPLAHTLDPAGEF
ncbi:MAG: AAA family ATPase [Caldilineaceae bacterium]